MIRQAPADPNNEFLLSELRRADICHPATLREDIVSSNCRIIYRVNGEPKTRAHLLVHPEDLIWPKAEISVTTPFGTALVGLSIGDRMIYNVDGSSHEVLVEGVGLRFLDEGLISSGRRAASARPHAYSGDANLSVVRGTNLSLPRRRTS
jgi:regulator of nucleoside diphosphate kinase